MLIIASVLFTISAYGTGAVDNFSWFIFYRILGGLGIGVASNISPIYIAEVAPASSRGKLVSLNQLTIVLGILLAQIVNWLIGESYSVDNLAITDSAINNAWRFMFWAELVPALLFFMMSFIIPESPRWLVLKNEKIKAVKIFTKIGGEKYAVNAVKEIITANASSSKDDSSLKQIFNIKYRKVLIIGIFLAVFQQWCGINVIFNYAHEIFSAAGYGVSDVLMNIVITGVTNLLFTFVAIFTVDKWGRRALMFTGSLGLAIIYLLIGASYYNNISGWPMLMLVVMAIACYAMSLAPVVWVVLSEIFPNKARGTFMALSTFFLWSACFILTYTFPILNESLGASGTFWIYSLICFMSFIFIKYQLPETKGKTLEQIEETLTNEENLKSIEITE